MVLKHYAEVEARILVFQVKAKRKAMISSPKVVVTAEGLFVPLLAITIFVPFSHSKASPIEIQSFFEVAGFPMRWPPEVQG